MVNSSCMPLISEYGSHASSFGLNREMAAEWPIGSLTAYCSLYIVVFAMWWSLVGTKDPWKLQAAISRVNCVIPDFTPLR